MRYKGAVAMRKLALAIGALLALMAASFVSPVGAVAASSTHSARVPGPHSGAMSPRSPVHVPSTRLRSPSTVAPPVNCDAGYHFVFSPNGPVAGPNFLVGTASVNAGDVWAVGNTTNASGYDQLLAEHWNGAGWTVATTPSLSAFHNDFNAVAAISTNDVWAVGEYWVDGNPSSISMIAEHWNGTTWTSAPMTQPSTFTFLFGVTAISTTNVWAVGAWINGLVVDTLVEHYDGTNWTQMPSTNPNLSDNELFAVSAFSATDVWVVGEQSDSISAPFQTLAQHWDGTAWSTLFAPNLGVAGSNNEILGVNALEAGHAVAVGYGYFTTDVNGNTVTPRQGAAWNLLAAGGSTGATVSGPGSGDNAFAAVARSGAGVWAVGFWRNTVAGPRQSMVFPATWNATSHTLTWGPMGASESPSGINNALIGVTAISPYNFWAAGYDTNGLNTAQTLTEAYCARNFTMTGPPTSHANFAFSVTVTVKNGDGSTATGYRGTVQFTSTDGTATLPANYAFVAGDNGAHTFSGVVLHTAGSQTITVADIAMPFTVPAPISVQVCVGLCQSSAGTPGSRPTNQGGTGTKGGRNGANQSGAGTPGPRVPRLGLSSQNSDNAPSTSPATTTGQATNVVAAAPEAASTSAESAPSAAGAAEAATNTSSAQAPTHRAASLLAQRQPVANPPEQTPWNVLLFVPLIACALALIAIRRRTSKEKSNGRI
jgi:hypothetical protein